MEKLRRDVAGSGQHPGAALVGKDVGEAGLLDRALLNDHIEAILRDASGVPGMSARIEAHLERVLSLAQAGDVSGAAKHVAELLCLELDDLRKAALLSLMVRMAGKRLFDPVAAHLLENRATYATQRG